MPDRKRDLSDPNEKQADLEERLKEKGLDPEGRPLSEAPSQHPRIPPPPD
jgi:hypothetical protein